MTMLFKTAGKSAFAAFLTLGAGLFVSPSWATSPADSGCTSLPINVGLFPQLSVAGMYHKPVSNVSFNLLVGKLHGLRGLELGAIANVETEFMRGGQIAAVNVVGGNVSGLQAALVNIAGSDVSGIQGAAFVNIIGASSSGGQSAGIGSLVGDGVQGSQTGGIFAIAGGDVEGFQGGGVVSIAGDDVNGVQVSTVASLAGGLVTGAQVSFIAAMAGEGVEGIQASMLFAAADVVHGAQVALVTAADSVFGVQLGFVNLSNRPDGYPIGFVNLIEGVPFRLALVGDESGSAQLEFKSGSHNAHGVISLGGRAFASPKTQALGLGVGFHFEQARYYADVDAITYGVLAADSGGEGAISTARVLFGVPIVPRVSLLGGLRMSCFVSDKATGAAFAPWTLYKRNYRGYTIRVWPGLLAGVSVTL